MASITQHPNSVLSVRARLRIVVRRIQNGWRDLPPWTHDALLACLIAFPLWLILCAALLVF